jgi:predicted site-specific integrase-resolvase
MSELGDSSREQAFAYRLRDAARMAGVSRATLYRAAGDGKVTIRKAKGRSVILAKDLQAWLESLPTMGPA